MTWYEALPARLVLEVTRVRSLNRRFQLCRTGDVLYWDGEVDEIPPGSTFSPLRIWVVYFQAYPATPPGVLPVNPKLPADELGHDWHRYYTGQICYVRPSYWQVSTTAADVIEKVADWYFNYTAKKAGLIASMPDVGRAEIEAH